VRSRPQPEALPPEQRALESPDPRPAAEESVDPERLAEQAPSEASANQLRKVPLEQTEGLAIRGPKGPRAPWVGLVNRALKEQKVRPAHRAPSEGLADLRRVALEELEQPLRRAQEEGSEPRVLHPEPSPREPGGGVLEAVAHPQKCPRRSGSKFLEVEEEQPHRMRQGQQEPQAPREPLEPPPQAPREPLEPLPQAPRESREPLPQAPRESREPLPQAPRESLEPPPQAPRESLEPLPQAPRESREPLPQAPRESLEPPPQGPSEQPQSEFDPGRAPLGGG
jgi:hypothetical protein